MSVEIHNTIAIFCKLLNVVYGTNLKPEYFRLAKFNKTDENVVRVLWNALYKISEEDNPTSLFEKFLKHNYVRKEFYTLKEGNCSRELLLALIYYLSTRLETDIQNKLNYNHEFSDIILRQGDGYYNETCRYSQFNWRKLNERDLDNYKKWLCGKIVSNNNMISEYNEQINRIQEKIWENYLSCRNVIELDRQRAEQYTCYSRIAEKKSFPVSTDRRFGSWLLSLGFILSSLFSLALFGL